MIIISPDIILLIVFIFTLYFCVLKNDSILNVIGVTIGIVVPIGLLLLAINTWGIAAMSAIIIIFSPFLSLYGKSYLDEDLSHHIWSFFACMIGFFFVLLFYDHSTSLFSITIVTLLFQYFLGKHILSNINDLFQFISLSIIFVGSYFIAFVTALYIEPNIFKLINIVFHLMNFGLNDFGKILIILITSIITFYCTYIFQSYIFKKALSLSNEQNKF